MATIHDSFRGWTFAGPIPALSCDKIIIHPLRAFNAAKPLR
jgi:hypothetical protein